MTKRIFRSIFISVIAVFLATMLMIIEVLYNYFTDAQQKQLSAETAMAAAAMEHTGAGFLEDLKADGYRITWIGQDGTVLFDSMTDSDSMENHLEREEIRSAMTDGYGESSRYSTTLMERSIYCAKRLRDGSVLRLSITHWSILMLLFGMTQPILTIVLIASVLSFVLANGLSQKIVEPMNKLDLDTPLKNDGYPELMPMLMRIHCQQIELRDRADALKQKQDELNTIIGNMKEGMLLADRNGMILAINRSARELLALKDIKEGEFLPMNLDPAIVQALRSAIQGTASESRNELKDAIIQISASPIQKGDEIACAAIVLFDITQRERAERQRREFTANVSHELKTPLHAISGYSELLKCGMVKPEDTEAFAENIYSETQRLIALVEDIISLSHLDEGGPDLKWEDMDLYEVADEVRGSLAELAGQNGIELSLTGTRSGIRGVRELVRGILYNLCDNAIKYNRPGGRVEITVDDRKLIVKDTGIGIPKEDLDRIFERFYRVDKSRSKEVGGTGLGLSIVKHATMIHNAVIKVESNVGEGTTVSVKFPQGMSIPVRSGE